MGLREGVLMSIFEPPEGYPDNLPCDSTGCGHPCSEHDAFGCLEVYCLCGGFQAPVPDEDDRDKAEVDADRSGLR